MTYEESLDTIEEYLKATSLHANIYMDRVPPEAGDSFAYFEQRSTRITAVGQNVYAEGIIHLQLSYSDAGDSKRAATQTLIDNYEKLVDTINQIPKQHTIGDGNIIANPETNRISLQAEIRSLME